MKTLLRKLMSPYLLTFHEPYTILIEADAILNSRPLVPINSTDVEDTLALTTGHFLIGRPLIAPPIHKEDTVVQVSLLKEWNLVQRLKQEIWSTWKLAICNPDPSGRDQHTFTRWEISFCGRMNFCSIVTGL